MKQMKISDEVHERLDEIKAEEGHRSFDSVIRTLLHETDNYEGVGGDDGE